MSEKRYRVIPEDPTTLESSVLRLWEEEDTFQRSLELTENGEPFVFYEGPPTANGRPGIHHVFARTIKDTFCRYQTMQGRSVTRIAGWDTHGLPVEVEAEKALGISGKPEIEKIGVERFTQVCREHIFTYKEEWEKLSLRIGFWLDYSRAYITCSPEFVESVWWALSQFHAKGLLYRGHKVVPFCPRCGTGLSSHEVALGYEEVTEPAVTVKFPVEGQPGEYLLAWTTTPWTLPGNVALAVSPMVAYVKARLGEEIYYLAERLADEVLGEGYEVLETMPGGRLEGIRYEPPFPFLKDAVGGDAWYVATADFVTADEGTGIVHTAVMYGQDDYELGMALGLPAYHLVDEQGRFTSDVEPWAGVFVKDADPKIIQALADSGHLWGAKPHAHTYPFCWRCDSPLLYYARDSWYLRTTAVKDRLMANNATVNWHPAEIGRGRMAEWLENNVDWALSRDRYWGTPLPVWLCDGDASHVEVIGSYAQLSERSGREIGAEFDPHKPFIDTVEWGCARCEGVMRRTPEVIDTWFDSGSMPFAQWHYPMENEGLFKGQFPANFIAEGVDQTRGWFYSLLAISTALFDRSPYENVVVNDLVLDADGVKMSKSRGNVVDPWVAIGEFGADAIRYYLLAVSNPWIPKRHDPKAIGEVRRKFFGTLLATYRFFELYANIESWTPEQQQPPLEQRPVLDRWILSRLDGLIDECQADMDRYNVTHAVRRIGEFVIDDLSNWYVRRSRPRFWGTRQANCGTMEAAFATLWEALLTVCRLVAPIAPFAADWIHRELAGGTSVHLVRYPVTQGRRDSDLEAAVEVGRKLTGLGRAAREAAGIRVRQPLRRLLAFVPGGRPAGMDEELLGIVRDELNVREITFVGDPMELVSLRAEPNFAALGPRFGSRAQAVAEAVRGLGSAAIASWRFVRGDLILEVSGERFEVPEEAVVVKEQPLQGYVVQSDSGVLIALDSALDPELRAEGTARELVNRIQRLRRDVGLELDDRIRLGIFGAPEVASAAEVHREYIAGEVLAVEVAIGREPPESDRYDHTREFELDEGSAVIGVQVR